MKTKILFILLLGLNLGFIFMNIPPAIDQLMALYGVTYTRISVLISALLWAHAALQVPGGIIADRIGTRFTLFISVLSILVGNLLPALSPHLGLAVVGRVFSGIGTGLSFIATMKMITIFAPAEKSGSYQAQLGGAFSLGSVAAYITVPLIIMWGWRWIHIVPAIACLPLLSLLYLIKLEEHGVSRSAPLPLIRVAAIPSGWILGAYHALSYGSVLTLGNWIPSLLADVWQGHSAAQLAWGGAIIMLVSGIGRMCGGLFLLKIPPVLMAHGSILILFFLLSFLSLFHTPGFVLILAFLAAWFASINFGAFWHIAARSAPSGSVGTIFGLVNLTANLGTIGFTLMFGWIKDSIGTFSLGFGVMAIIALLALVIGRPIILKAVPVDYRNA